MQEKRKEYIEQLLRDLKELENRVLTIRDEDALPFSFFRESFDKTQGIMRVLHELEILQIDGMKRQMERLVSFLSETENRQPRKENPIAEEPVSVPPPMETTPEIVEEIPEGLSVEIPQEVSETITESPIEEPVSTKRNAYAEGLILPEYKNPRAVENVPPVVPAQPVEEEIAPVVQEEKAVMRSLNDVIQAPPAVLDLKRSISLNDRFLFQRELFNNDRYEMNNMMIKLNAFDNFDDAERYLRENTSWNFEDDTVKDFLRTIQKGFE